MKPLLQRRRAKPCIRHHSGSTSNSRSCTDLAPSDSASNVRKGKRRAQAESSETGSGETSELVRQGAGPDPKEQPCEEEEEEEEEAPSQPPSDISALYIPSNSANNLMPCAAYFVYLTLSLTLSAQ